MRKQGRFFQVLAISFSSFLAAACAPQGSPFIEELSSKALENIGCETLKSTTFDVLYKMAEFDKALPSSEQMRELIEEKWKKDPRASKISKAEMDTFIKEYSAVLDSIKSKLPSDWESLPQRERIEYIAELEIKDNSTVEKVLRNQNFQASWDKVESSQSLFKSSCSAPQDIGKYLDIDQPEIYGSHKVFATAYQGCSSLELRVMNDQSPALQGVVVTGKHSSGGGNNRVIADVGLAYKTHFYISKQQPDTKCQDLSKTPLIYDFGGKPFVTSIEPNKMNFFKNGGSGTKELGVDCGGYVFTALMAAGLRLRANEPLKPMQIDYLSASANPVTNNYNCFDYVPGNSAVRSGDIVSTPGHIIMIDGVGNDPFGLASITRIEDCREGVIKSDNFNFAISQSSPSKGAIGLNRIQASTYSKEASSYRAGFISHAIALCKSRFGVSASPNRTNFWMIRHKKTAACRQPEIKLEKEECIARCM